MGEPVGPLHAISDYDDEGQTLCGDSTAKLTVVAMSWAETAGRRCPGCEIIAGAFGEH